jgi:tubulin monoglycylase TTLL3/8
MMEIFGFDFMLNDKCELYLIEANTNPCLEESSPLVATLLQRMISNQIM